MFFAVDIDGVLARDTTGYATYMNSYFHLGIEQSLIDSLTSYAQFIEIEAVRSFVRGNESRAAEFNSVAKDAQYAPLVQQMRIPIDGAVEAVQHIAQFYSFRYVTCRKRSTLPVTQEWLDRYGFPTPENVSCCEQGIHQKYLEAYHFAAAWAAGKIRIQLVGLEQQAVVSDQVKGQQLKAHQAEMLSFTLFMKSLLPIF